MDELLKHLHVGWTHWWTVHIDFNFDTIWPFIFSVINDSLAELPVVIWLSIYDYVNCFSGKSLHVFNTPLNLNLLSFHYFANCKYTCTRRKKWAVSIWWKEKMTKTPMKNVLKTIWKRCENLTWICYYVLRTLWVLNQNVL